MIISKRKYKRANLRKFNNKKFNIDNFVNSYYLKNGKAYLTINVENYNDIVSKFSTKDHEWINPSFKDYLDDVTNYIPFDEDLIIEITGSKFTEDEKNGINNAIMNNFNLELAEITEELNANHSQSKFLVFLAIITIIVYIIFIKINTNSFIREIVNVVFWFFLWEYFDSTILERSDIKDEKIEAARLASSTIIFN